jgi:hypothetical protein
VEIVLPPGNNYITADRTLRGLDAYFIELQHNCAQRRAFRRSEIDPFCCRFGGQQSREKSSRTIAAVAKSFFTHQSSLISSRFASLFAMIAFSLSH